MLFAVFFSDCSFYLYYWFIWNHSQFIDFLRLPTFYSEYTRTHKKNLQKSTNTENTPPFSLCFSLPIVTITFFILLYFLFFIDISNYICFQLRQFFTNCLLYQIYIFCSQKWFEILFKLYFSVMEYHCPDYIKKNY